MLEGELGCGLSNYNCAYIDVMYIDCMRAVADELELERILDAKRPGVPEGESNCILLFKCVYG